MRLIDNKMDRLTMMRMIDWELLQETTNGHERVEEREDDDKRNERRESYPNSG